MAKRQPKSHKPVLILPTAVVAIFVKRADEIRRLELGVESLCDLAAEIMQEIERGTETLPKDVAARFSGLSMAAWGCEVPEDLSKFACPHTTTLLLWKCLTRISELTDCLIRQGCDERWRKVHDVIDAWESSFGSDEVKVRIGQARFRALTGMKRRKGPQVAIMGHALMKSLAAVQA